MNGGVREGRSGPSGKSGLVISSSRTLFRNSRANSFGLASQSGIGVSTRVSAHWSHARHLLLSIRRGRLLNYGQS